MLFNGKKDKKTPRVPIYINGTYLFDVLGESNMSQTTRVVTVVKEGKKENSYVVVSMNNGDVFECDEHLLTSLVDYELIRPMIRCQYGTTDFTNEDVLTYQRLLILFQPLYEKFINDNFIQEKYFMDEILELGNKIKKYADISTFKYQIETMRNVKKCMDDHKTFLSLTSKLLDNNKQGNEPCDDIEIAKAQQDKVYNSEFYNKFNDLVYRYHADSIPYNDFVDSAVELIENSFPISCLIPQTLTIITKDELNNIKEDVEYMIQNNMTVFLIGADEEGNIITYSVCAKTYDIENIGEFFDEVYYSWDDSLESYEAHYKCATINVILNEEDIEKYGGELQ